LAWAVALAWLALLPGCDTTPSEVVVASRQASAPAGRGPELSAWYAITLQGPWQGDMLLDAVQTSDHRPMSVNVAAYDILETTFYDHLLSEAAAGGAPDIAYVGTPAELARLVQAGVLEPLNVCNFVFCVVDHNFALSRLKSKKLVIIWMNFTTNIFTWQKRHKHKLTLLACIQHLSEISIFFC